MRFQFYDCNTGVLHGNVYSTSIVDPARALESAQMNAPPEHLAIEGEYDRYCQRLDVAAGVIVNYQPPQPSADHEWNETSKRWRLNAEASGRAERKAVALTRIAHLEANVQPRAQRELILKIANRLGIDGEQSQNIDDEIAGLRKHLEG